MSSYLVLARKYRSKQFADIVGQQAVVRTLVNAIKLERTHQAYVFSGSRGIGKTSIARIFAKALRCQNVVEKDGLLYSCDQCSDCIEIAAGNSVNVLEIDGASNNGVDSVREIRENAKFLPTSGKYKIYIIDEVHMLSTQAFNALLKTLEEPPEHVVFIFATTESHKIPETILGRCQRFDFKRHTVSQITQRLKEVLAAEKIKYEDAALNLISRAAEGSMRDGLSITDQVISFSGMNITAQSVRDSIGLIGTEMVYALLKNVLGRNAKEALIVVQTAFNQGVDLKILLKVVIEMLHALILMQAGIEKPETNFSDDELSQISGMKTLRSLEENELIFQVFHHGLDLLSRASQPKLVFDLLVIKSALAEELIAYDGAEVSEQESSAAPRRVARPVTPSSGIKFASEGDAQEAPQEIPSQPDLPNPEPAKPEIFPQTPQPEIHQPNTPGSPDQPEIVPPRRPEFPRPELPTPKRPEIPQPDSPGHMPIKPIAGPKTSEGFMEYCFQFKPVLAVTLESVVEWTLPTLEKNLLRLGFREHDKAKLDQFSYKGFKDQLNQASEAYFGFKVLVEAFLSQMTGESVAEKTIRMKKESKEKFISEQLKAIHSHAIIIEAKSLFGAENFHIEIAEREV